MVTSDSNVSSRLASRLSFASAFNDTGTDYTTDTQKFHIWNEALQPIELVNSILCFTEQMRANEFVNAGPYAVLANDQRCFSEGGNNDSSGTGGQSSGAGEVRTVDVLDGYIGFTLYETSVRDSETFIQSASVVMSEDKTDGVAITSQDRGAFSGLNSVYEMKWAGPWVGFRVHEQRGIIGVRLDLRYHFQNDYRGEAEWNLRSDLQQPLSFAHDADADGVLATLSYEVTLNLETAVGSRKSTQVLDAPSKF